MNRKIYRIALSVFALGSAFSTPGLASTNCIPAPDGLVSWWRAENDATDFKETNNGTLGGTTTFGAGQVGQGFVFSANGDVITVGNPPNLQLQNFTIEAWIQRASDSVVSLSGAGAGVIFGYGFGGYSLVMSPGGGMTLSAIGVSSTAAGPPITDTSLHHIAVTRSGATVVFYIDGVGYLAPAYPGSFSFSTPAAIGARGDNLDNSFLGVIDEVSVYNRALTSAEVQAVYEAASFGKCTGPTPPVIITQPTNQTIMATESTAFSVSVLGDKPIAYQWIFNSSLIPNATNATLLITNAQDSQAGDYFVIATNLHGAATSSPALLTVDPPPPCTTPPAGLVSWWPGEGHAVDVANGNSGTLAGNVSFASARVGQAFVFDGNGDAIRLGNPTNLQLQDITVEAWIKRGSASQASLNAGGGVVFGGGIGSYAFGFFDNGQLYLSKPGGANVTSTFQVTDTNFHHLAWTKEGTNVTFYLDGTNYPAAGFNPIFTFGTDVAIGARGDNLANSFLGVIDELAVFNRALTQTEIQSIIAAKVSGKCALLIPPVIGTHPRSTNAVAGTNVIFTVVAGGPVPISHQWRFNNTDILGATNSSLVVSNVQFTNAGLYSVLVGNTNGSILSSNAALTVVFPNAVVRALNANTIAGSSVVVPITITANGNENSVGFSLNFNTQRLAFASVTLGSGTAGGTLFLNSSMINTGRLGVAVALPFQTIFSPGTQEVVRVTFNSLPLLGTTPNTNVISFADQPVLREILDPQLLPLSANYSNATIVLTPTVFEGDVSPRTNGNQAVSAADWLQMGRFAARLDSFATSNEFQRADCAPRATLGDGQIKVTDWVQAGRCLAGLDALAVAGGPVAESGPTLAGIHPTRQLVVSNVTATQSGVASISITLDAVGNENGIGFTLAFDPAALTFSSVTLGSGASDATLIPNTSQTASGRLGVALSLASGGNFGTGARVIANIHFIVTAASGTFPLTLTDQVVTRCVSDIQAGELPVSFVIGTLHVVSTNTLPTLAIVGSGSNVVVSWPSWAGDFTLQTVETISSQSSAWTNTPAQTQTNAGEIHVTLPGTNSIRLFRLKR